MKVLSAQQIQALDQFTIQNEPIASHALMWRAATAWVNELKATSYFKNLGKQVCILVGPGNNGGDGLCIAKLLAESGFECTILGPYETQKTSADFQYYWPLVSQAANCTEVTSIESFTAFDWVVDALFGSGLNKPIIGQYAKIIENLNAAIVPVFSVDIPSGLFSEYNNQNNGAIVEATCTISFEVPKLAFFFAENAKNLGQVILTEIGLNQAFKNELPSSVFVVTTALIQEIYTPRSEHSHKGNFGHSLLIGGAFGKGGAIQLAAKACLLCGSGLTTVVSADCNYTALQVAVPEAMFVSGGAEKEVVQLPQKLNYSAYGIGPGLGANGSTQNCVKSLLLQANGNVVVDADALNILAENKTWLEFLPPNTILTPHPKEFDRLFGAHKTHEERFKTAQKMAVQCQCIVVLKGRYSMVFTPQQQIFINTTGNSGLAKGGSGDTLTGIITSLLAQGYTANEAAIFGNWLLGAAANRLQVKLGAESCLASTVAQEIPFVFKELALGLTQA